MLSDEKENPLPPIDCIPGQEEKNPSLSSFFLELVSRVKKTLASIRAYNDLSKGRFKDVQFGGYFNQKMNEEVEKLYGVIESLLDYMKVNTPILKTNTIHNILEEILRLENKKIEGKKLKVFKRLAKDLPETTLHNEQFKYILHSILQYAFPIIPAGGSLGFLTRAGAISKEEAEEGGLSQGAERWIEILILFSGFKKPEEPVEIALGIPGIPKDDVGDLILRLVKEIVQKNCGQMRIDRREKQGRTLVVLRLPAERRKVYDYQSARA
jgi:hypothetical protein